MRVHPQSTLNRRPAARRAGLAQVELALALPLLAAMWMILHTACDVGVARSETTIAARHDAWRKIGGPVSNKTLAAGGQSVDQIL
ncbi:MAG: hypothetical protein O3A00_27095, partial [Planctomycetota bacterium]|nr:hypothetical protein [Planctomycetota bacterium]